MPYPRHKPVSEKAMNRKIYEGENTICQTIRDMYHISDNQDIRLKCRLAMAMAKAMCVKLMEYREIYGAKEPEFQDGI